MKYIKRSIKFLLLKFGYSIVPTKRLYFGAILRHLRINLVLDVGANEGQFARSIRYEGYKGRIVSFEPTSAAYSELKRNSEFDSGWIVYPQCAVGDATTPVKIHVSGNNALSSSVLEANDNLLQIAPSTETVRVETVNQITLNSIWTDLTDGSERILIKLDVQGYEKNVLEGIGEKIKCIVAIKIELSCDHLYQNDKLFDFYFNYTGSH